MKRILPKKPEAAKSLLKDQNCNTCWVRFYSLDMPGRWCYICDHRPEFGICRYWHDNWFSKK